MLPFDSESGRGFGSVFHHQNLTPNPSRLGVFICASRMTRGVPAHSACIGFSGLTTGLDDQLITEAATGTERVTSARGKRALLRSTRGWYCHLHGTRGGIHSREASSPFA